MRFSTSEIFFSLLRITFSCSDLSSINFSFACSILSFFIESASILASFYNNEIPIHAILKEKNNTAIVIENIAESRNKVGHKYVEISDKEIDEYFDDAKAMQKDIEEIIQIFLKN